MSGTGKTSLVQCGLSGKFDGPDWLPIWVRRRENINDSLQEAIEGVWPEGRPMEAGLKAQVTLLYRFYLRPVYLIFDQLEELFILGDEEHHEETLFTGNLRQLLDAGLPCKVIVSIREEFIGQLYRMEQRIPTIYDFRLRVEPMGRARVKEVIGKSFDRFNISLEKPVQNLDLICNYLSAGKSGIQLPFLQIYLDQLYKEEFRRTYPEEEALATPPKPLVFKTKEIEAFGNIEKVLARFLLEQEQELEELLQEEIRTDLPPNTVRQILDAFVTEEGTKRPVPYIQEGKLIRPQTGHLQLFPQLPEVALSRLLHRLIDNRLLRQEARRVELSHDALAALIDRERSDQQRRVNQLQSRIVLAEKDFEKTNDYLGPGVLGQVDELWDELEPRLEEKQRVFIRESKKKQVEELETERRKRRRSNLLAAVAGIAAAVAIGLFIWALVQQNRAIRNEEKAKSASLALFKNIIGNVNDDILNLEYARAREKLIAMVDDPADPFVLGDALMEIAYVDNQTGKLERALDLTDTIGRLYGLSFQRPTISTRPALDTLFKQWNPDRFTKLEARYYPTMISVRGGVFTMGCDLASLQRVFPERTCREDELPQYAVELSSFAMAETETTVWQFDIFAKATGFSDDGYKQFPEWPNIGNNPVTEASFFDAIAYANWVSQQKGLTKVYNLDTDMEDPNNLGAQDINWQEVVRWDAAGYRLPTEAEWEYAARGGQESEGYLFSGSNNPDEVAWYSDNEILRTQPVKEKLPNELGLYDMSGNVWEWSWSRYGKYQLEKQKNPRPVLEERTPPVLRGGSWWGGPFACLVTFRRSDSPYDKRSYNLGFRLVRRAL
jgi:formylglycine-generating enzyme required for sulfatase activity